MTEACNFGRFDADSRGADLRTRRRGAERHPHGARKVRPRRACCDLAAALLNYTTSQAAVLARKGHRRRLRGAGLNRVSRRHLPLGSPYVAILRPSGDSTLSRLARPR